MIEKREKIDCKLTMFSTHLLCLKEKKKKNQYLFTGDHYGPTESLYSIQRDLSENINKKFASQRWFLTALEKDPQTSTPLLYRDPDITFQPCSNHAQVACSCLYFLSIPVEPIILTAVAINIITLELPTCNVFINMVYINDIRCLIKAIKGKLKKSE